MQTCHYVKYVETRHCWLLCLNALGLGASPCYYKNNTTIKSVTCIWLFPGKLKLNRLASVDTNYSLLFRQILCCCVLKIRSFRSFLPLPHRTSTFWFIPGGNTFRLKAWCCFFFIGSQRSMRTKQGVWQKKEQTLQSVERIQNLNKASMLFFLWHWCHCQCLKKAVITSLWILATININFMNSAWVRTKL